MSRSFALAWSGAALAALAPSVLTRPQASTADFRTLDAIEGAWLNFPNFVVRGMALSPNGADLYALNQHDDTVVKFAAFSGGTPPAQPLEPLATYPAPWDPVSIAYWEGTNDTTAADDELLVVGRGNWGVMGISVATGNVTRFLQLVPGTTLPGGIESRMGWMAEPADILVDDDTDMAFVSCSGADSVIQIDLSGPAPGEIVRVFHESVTEDDFRCKHPLFLSWDPDETPEEPRKVIVTPMISGNNSMWEATHSLVAGQIVLDLADDQVTHVISGEDFRGLPDEDAFRITPFEADLPGERGSVEPAARGTGTLLFAHGTNPKNGRFWQLNTEAKNKTPEMQSEPHLKGVFSFNRLTRIVLGTGVVEATENDVTSLDPVEMTGDASNFDSSTTLGQPFGLDFSPDGLAMVSGLLTNNVALFSATGNLIVEADLAPLPSDPSWTRTIPRSVLFKENTSIRLGDFLVYCWGDNTIRQIHYDLSAAPTLTEAAVYDLGRDPTPDPVARGRNLFFDGSNSAHGNLACASCHVEGGSDMLVWNLSNNPRGVADPDFVIIDAKGGMLTQTMTGLERVGPFHWRGERSLADFNGAFEGLLGGETLDPAELADFVTFVESLRNPANPNENRDRVVDDSISFIANLVSPVADAVMGQDMFHDDIVLEGRFTCGACHMAPIGTNNDTVDEVAGSKRTRLAHRKPAPFHDMWRRQQSAVFVDLDSTGQGIVTETPFLGAAINHVGNDVNLVDFVTRITQPGTDQTKNISAFIHQLDSGVAPAAHFGFYLDAGSHSLAQTELAYVIGQATNPVGDVEAQCDVVAYGTRWTGLSFVTNRWAYDRHSGTFLADDSNVTSRTLTNFLDGALQSGERTVFLGTPAGAGKALAIDADMDGQRDANDANPETPDVNVNDATAPVFVRSPEVLWETARAARIRFETDEPVSVLIRYRRAAFGTSWREVTSAPGVFGEVHSYLLNDLEPSTAHYAANPREPGPWGIPVYVYEDQSFFPVDSEYDVEVEVTDRNGNTTLYAESDAVQTTPFLEAQEGSIPATDAMTRHHHMAHILTELSMDPLEEDAGWVTARVHAEVSYRRGGDWVGDTYTYRAAARRIVVGRALLKYSDTALVNGTMQNVDRYKKLDPVPVANVTHSFDDIRVSPGNDADKMAIGGAQAGSKFLVSAELSDFGNTMLEFQVPSSALEAGDSIVFVVDGVFEVPDDDAWDATDKTGPILVIPAALPAPWNTTGSLSLSRWSFPGTGEANSVVERSYP